MPSDMIARFLRIAGMIANNGLLSLREPQIRHLTGKLWEMRLSGRDGIARSIYIAAHERRVVVLRTFVKKTEQTPRREIEIAFERMKEVRE